MFLFLGASTASATTMQQLSVSELTWVSDLVAEAVVESNSVERVEGQEFLRTVSSLRLTRVVKGELAEGDRVDVLALGGILGTEETRLPSAPVFAPEERVLVFLELRDGEWHSVGLSQGKFTMIEEEDTGRDVLVKVQPPRNLKHFDEGMVLLPARRLYADDLLGQVQDDLRLGYVPPYQNIAGLSPAKDARFRDAARSAGRLDSRWEELGR